MVNVNLRRSSTTTGSYVLAVFFILLVLGLGCRGILAIEDRAPCEQSSCIDEHTMLACHGSAPPTAEQCPASTPRCTAGACVCAPGCKDGATRIACSTGVAVDETCPAETPICDGAGTCVSCREADRCGADHAGCYEGAACLGFTAKIYAGRVSSCLRAHDGVVFCWGLNQTGEVGTGNSLPVWLPVRVNGIPPMKELALGYYHTCGLTADGEVWCWGTNRAGQLGNGSGVEVDTTTPPTRVANLPPGVKAITAGSAHNCVIAQNDEVWCWGYNDYYQCGPNGGELRGVLSPVLHPGAGPALRLVTAKEHTCAIRKEKPDLVCWGDNQYGQLGPSLTTPAPVKEAVPIEVPAAGVAVDVGPSFEDVCAVFGNFGETYCWGYNRRGQRGNGTKGESFDPNPTAVLIETSTSPAHLKGVTEIYATQGSHRCVKSNDDRLSHPFLCWGGNDRGELGFGKLETRGEEIVYARFATAIPKNTFSLSLGDDHTCFIAGSPMGPFTAACMGEPPALGASAAPDPAGAEPIPLKVRFPPR